MNIAIVLSGGVGSRMGLGIPKQYVLVKEIPIIGYCLQTFFLHDAIDALVVVLAEEWKSFVEETIEHLKITKPVYYAPAGETRQYSLYNGLKCLHQNGFKDDDKVIVHDAARPLVSSSLISRCLNAIGDADAVLPVIPMKDTTYLSADGIHIDSLLNRSHLWAGQAPEAFRLGNYLRLHDDTPRDSLLKINGSTELAQKAGWNCVMVPGDPMNFKITTSEDLSNFESIIKERML